MTVDARIERCPHCDIAFVSEEDAAPWCAGCEWNLDAYAAPDEWPWYRRSMALLDHRYGFRADLRLATADPGPRHKQSLGFVFLCAVSAALVAVPLLALLGGLYLILWHRHNLDIVLDRRPAASRRRSRQHPHRQGERGEGIPTEARSRHAATARRATR